ncbi:MAG: hypothetical protein LBC98_04725 [Prevotellaceae bacterium]|nr:hypothetical protein [Prevotellaceae bacterium]
MSVLPLTGCGNPKGKGGSGTVYPPEIVKPKINVYIENSGSMDGYVKGVTEFEQIVYNYLSDINNKDITDTMNLFYINSEILPQGQVTKNNMNVLTGFIATLDPKTFNAKGGGRGTSDIAKVLDSVLQRTNENTVSILVTDGIFSPGKGIKAAQYLPNQQIGIKNAFVGFCSKVKDAAVLVYQLSSQFNGTYYNKEDSPKQIEEQRPFYIWVIGNEQSLKTLRNKIPDHTFIGKGVEHVFAIASGNKEVNYAIKPGSGVFHLDKTNPKTTIKDWKKNSKGGGTKLAQFSVNVDFSAFLQDDAYLPDTSNYDLNDKDFTLSITKAASGSYTHSLNIQSPIIKKAALSIKLLSKVPTWVEDINDDDGSAAVPGKTFGIKYQINGLHEAFTLNGNHYTEIKIFIK